MFACHGSQVLQRDGCGELSNGPKICNGRPWVIFHAILIPKKRINRPIAPQPGLSES